MIKDQTEKPADISKILKLALEYNPSLAMRDISTPRMWVSSGCDVDLDIIPTMTDIIKKPRQRLIGSFSYFTTAIMAAKDRRTTIPEILEQIKQQESPEIIKERIMQGRLWKRKIGLFMTDKEEKELDDWIQKSPTRVNGA